MRSSGDQDMSAAEQLPLNLDEARPLAERRDNMASEGLSDDKLNGRVYTPLTTAVAMLDRLPWPSEEGSATLLDPACGDGVFLEAALRKLARHSPPDSWGARAAQVVGWDIDPDAVRAARQRLRRVCDELNIPGDGPAIVHRDALEPTDTVFDVIVGNPPYLEAKRMPAHLKQQVKGRCPVAARGAFDLYGAFVELSASLLTPEGALSLLLPNRILVTRSPSHLRRWLLDRGSVRVADLSAEGIFGKEAAVYPVVLEFRAGPGRGYSVNNLGAAAVFELPNAVVVDRLDGLMPLPPSSPVGAALLERVLVDPGNRRLSDVFEVRWTVSFHRGGLRDQYVFPDPPDQAAHPRRFLGGGRFQGNREVGGYRVDWAGHWIDYDEDRARADKNPLPPLGLFEGRKVVVCQNARRGRAALDEDGFILKDTFVCVRAREGVSDAPGWLEWLVLLVNSDVFHYLYEHLYGGTRKGGGYLHYLGSYLNPFPLPPPEDLDLVCDLHARLVADSTDEKAARQVEEMLRRAFGVSAAEDDVLDAYPYPQH